MRSTQLLVAFFGYLTLFAAAAPLQAADLGVVDGTSTDLDRQRRDVQDHQSIGELFIAGHALSVPELTGSIDSTVPDTDGAAGLEKRTKKKSTKTTKKPKKTTKKPKKTTKKPKKPKATKKPKKPKKPTACTRKQKRNGESSCEEPTEAYKVVLKAAKKAKVTLREGKSYAMIQKPASGLINHHRLVVAKVIKTGNKLDIDAKMTELRKDEGPLLSGADTDQYPKDAWACDKNAASNKYKLKGEVSEAYELFESVKQKGDSLIVAGGKYNIITNNCQGFAKDLAKAITQ